MFCDTMKAWEGVDGLKPSMILLDLDGTALRSDLTLSPYTLDVLGRCKQRGILVGIATARSIWGAGQYSGLINWDARIICGGAAGYLGDRLAYERTLGPETTDGIIKACLCSEHAGAITVQTGDMYLSNERDFQHMTETDGAAFSDFAEPFGSSAYKITIEIFSDTFAQQLGRQFDCSVTRFHGENWVQFCHREASKHQAMQALARGAKIPMERVMAFGDDYSDLSMLATAGFGVAMKNAIKEVKQAAAYQTELDNDNDGAAKFIEKYVLEGE